MIDLFLRALLLLYPADTRRRFSYDLLEMMRWKRRRYSGGTVRFCVAMLMDTLTAAPAAHLSIWAERVGSRPRPPPPLEPNPRINPEKRGGRQLAPFLKDLVFGWRSLSRSPGFAAAAVVTLAVGIGANAAVFSLLHTVLFRPLPFPEGESLVMVGSTAVDQDRSRLPLSYPDLKDIKEESETLSGLAGAGAGSFTLTGDGPPRREPGAEVTSDFTDVLGVQPILGRGFLPEEEAPGVGRVVLIGAGLWQERFGGDPEIIGKVITTDGEPSTIVGVMPGHFHFPGKSMIWSPFRIDRNRARGARFITGVGRLAPEVTLLESRTELSRIALGLARAHPESNRQIGARISSLRDGLFGEERHPVIVFYAAVSLILLLACANVAGLLLARNEERTPEMAVRAALGAGTGHITRQLLAEGLLLACLGGALGTILAWFGQELLLRLIPGDMPTYFWHRMPKDVLLAIVGIVSFSAVLFGMGPALAMVRSDLRGALLPTGAKTPGRLRRIRLRSVLVASEVALALTVLIGANLMLKSVFLQRGVDPGFTAEDVATILVTLPDGEWPEEGRRRAFFEGALERIRAVPGVERATMTAELPTGYTRRWRSIWAEGEEPSEHDPVPRFRVIDAGVDFFTTLGIPILSGRGFDEGDALADAPKVAVVSGRLAELLWPGEKAVGKRIAQDRGAISSPSWFEVIGVVGEIHNTGYGQAPDPTVYFSIDQETSVDYYLMAKTRTNARRFGPSLRDAIWEVNPDVPLSEFKTLEQAILADNWQVPSFSWALSIFSLIALLLASTGVYGITAHSVNRRAREFALRVAVGAPPSTLRGSILNGGLVLAGVGILVGLAFSLAGMPLIAALLFRVSPLDGGAFTLSIVVMVLVSLLASYLPARRITRMNPMSVLGRE